MLGDVRKRLSILGAGLSHSWYADLVFADGFKCRVIQTRVQQSPCDRKVVAFFILHPLEPRRLGFAWFLPRRLATLRILLAGTKIFRESLFVLACFCLISLRPPRNRVACVLLSTHFVTLCAMLNLPFISDLCGFEPSLCDFSNQFNI